MRVFTKSFMLVNRGCYSIEKLQACSFMKLKEITLLSIIESEIPLKDKFWFICNKIATKKENQQLAIKCAEIVLPIYEKIYPNNKAPHEAIESAKLYITRRIPFSELLSKIKAANAATYAAANAAINAATNAAATYAANAATYTANAATYAAGTNINILIALNQILLNYCKS